MNISVGFLPYILVFTAVLPAIFAVSLASKQNRSRLTSGVVTFALVYSTWIGGWIHLAIMNLLQPKEESKEQ
jgi:hypothetical protein